MSNRLTLEGDQPRIPSDLKIVRVFGKFVPEQELQGDEFLGDFYLEGFEYDSPSLSGSDSENQILTLGKFYHDDAVPIILSGDELQGFSFGKGFKIPKFGGLKFPKIKLKIPNVGKQLGKVGKEIGKGVKNVGKEVSKGARNYAKTVQKTFQDAGKFAGKIAETGMDVLQAVGSQGQPMPESMEEEPAEDSEYYEEYPEEISEDYPNEEFPEYVEEGELGFLPAVMGYAQSAGSIFNAVNQFQEQKADAKNKREVAKISALAKLINPPKAQPQKRAVSPKASLSMTPEGKMSLSYGNTRDANQSNTSTDSNKEDKDKMMYIGIGVAVLLVVGFFAFNQKGRK